MKTVSKSTRRTAGFRTSFGYGNRRTDTRLRTAVYTGFALIAFAATKYVIVFAKGLGLIDDPKKSSHPKVIHSYPVPRAGGLSDPAQDLANLAPASPFQNTSLSQRAQVAEKIGV